MTTMTRDSCEKLGFLDPTEVADAIKATGIPKAPDVRPCADELHPINPHESTAMNVATGLAAVAGPVAGFLS